MHPIPEAHELLGQFMDLRLRWLSQDFAEPHAHVSPIYHSEAETWFLFTVSAAACRVIFGDTGISTACGAGSQHLLVLAQLEWW